MGLFDILQDTVLRRGKDTPILRKGMEKASEILAEKQRERVESRWPLASNPDGPDIFSKVISDTWWALNLLYLDAKEFKAQRYDGLDASGWRIGRGTHIGVFDIDTHSRAGSDGREHNDLWLEALHEPIFGWLAYSPYPDVWLEDNEQHYRRVEIADELPELQRHVHTGKLRGSDTWTAVTHLDPLVLRIRLNTQDASRDRVQYAMHGLLERLDVEAFVAWRARVRPAAAPEPPEPAPEPPVSAKRLPPPDAIKAGLDLPPVDPDSVRISPDRLSVAFAGPIEKVRPFAIDGAEGMRYQAQGGRILDMLRITDPGLAVALGEGNVEGIAGDAHPSPQGRVQFSYLADDADGATRALFLRDDGEAFIARVRGMKREDAYSVIGVVLDRYRG